MEHSIIIVGDSEVGKTSYIKLLTTKICRLQHVKTSDPRVYKYIHKKTTFKIYDTIGSEDVPDLSDYNIDYAIIMFDLTNSNSLNNIINYYNNIKDQDPNINIILCGNKCDMRTNIYIDDVQDICDRLNILHIVNISCKKKLHIYDPLDIIIENNQ